ncbi:MAG: hypothetical protein ABSH50_02070 [Bryobacteraceae bacterium]|jgi:hypothetical protein
MSTQDTTPIEGDSSSIRENEPTSVFDTVAYTFVNYAEVYCTEDQVRIAFGDDLPTGVVQPKIGLVMPASYAAAFSRRLADAITDSINSAAKPQSTEPADERGTQ